MPTVMTWTRLEPHSRGTALDAGLRAEVRDPLWMLGRQWQLGELQGDDAGSPVQIRVRMDCTPLTRYLPGGVPASWYEPRTPPAFPLTEGRRLDRMAPLEAVVERERVRYEERFAPRLAAEAGLHFLRVLASEGGGALRTAVIGMMALDGTASASIDGDTRRFLSVTAGRVPDGALLASVLRVVATPGAITALSEPYRTKVAERVTVWQAWRAALAASDRTRVDSAAGKYLRWYDTLFRESSGTIADTSWLPERLEYEIAVAAPAPKQEVLLTAAEYTDGRLDWHSFDVLSVGSIGATRTDLSASEQNIERVTRTVLPTPVRYPGMPSARYFEFEDSRVDFGAIATGTQQLAHLLLVEFALVSGDDWWIVPIDMPVGVVSTMRWVVVTDTFGDRTLVSSASKVDRDAGRAGEWTLFEFAPDTRPVTGAARARLETFLLAPALATSLHSDPIEEIVLVRDDLANLAWAVERMVESPLGRPLNRAEAYHRSVPLPPTGGDAAAGAGTLRYTLATPVPPHWMPLLPTPARTGAPELMLLRGGIPEGRVLESRPPDADLLIVEDEVPRSGARVTRAFQYARWIDGSTHLWVGRRKIAGRAEGSSGLRFDRLEPQRSQA